MLSAFPLKNIFQDRFSSGLSPGLVSGIAVPIDEGQIQRCDIRKKTKPFPLVFGFWVATGLYSVPNAF